MVTLAGLHDVSRDLSDEFPYSSICVIHKISVNFIGSNRSMNFLFVVLSCLKELLQ